jgi:uncharacterized membrane protein YjjP (DUF1212 family)/uncharacterized membrane protein YjjB (DUF3815 family)
MASPPRRTTSEVSGKGWLWEALRVELSARRSVEEMLDEAKGLEDLADTEAHIFGRSCHSLDRPLGFGNMVTEREVLEMYDANTSLKEKCLGILLVLKLSVALLEYGQNSVDAELMLEKVCHSLGMPRPRVDLGARSVTIQLGNGPVHLLHCRMDLVVDKLMDVSALCKYISHHPDVDVVKALCVFDMICDRPLPYGELIAFVNLWAVMSWAAMAAFFGTWWDMLAVVMIAPFVLLMREFCTRKGLGKVELVLCSIVAGLLTPLVWKHVIPVPACQVPIIWGSAMLIYLPGCELIYGAYEIKYGSIINGGAQLVAALVRCALMGMGLTIGWQVFGRDAYAGEVHGREGAIASLVPVGSCSSGFAGPPWYVVFGVLNFPMLFHCFVSLNMRLADIPYAFGVVYPSLFAFIAVSLAGPIPVFVIDAFGIFLAANLASALERWKGTPVCVTIVPMVIILAPGWPSVKSLLASMQVAQDVNQAVTPFWTNLVLQGVAYAIGLSLAQVLWRLWTHRRTTEAPALEHQ